MGGQWKGSGSLTEAGGRAAHESNWRVRRVGCRSGRAAGSPEQGSWGGRGRRAPGFTQPEDIAGAQYNALPLGQRLRLKVRQAWLGSGRRRAVWAAVEGALPERRREAQAVGGRRTPGSLKIGRVGPEPCDGDVTRGVRVHPKLLPREIRVAGAELQQPPSRLGGVALPSGEQALLAEHL